MSAQTQITLETGYDVGVLSALLQEQLLVLQRMKDLAERQRSILVSRQSDAVWDNLSEVEACWQTLQGLESRREALAERISRSLSKGDQKMSLPSLIAVLPPETADPLGRLCDVLAETTRELAQLNAQNGDLIRDLLFLTGHQLQFYTALGQGFQPYNASGQRAGGGAPAGRAFRSA